LQKLNKNLWKFYWNPFSCLGRVMDNAIVPFLYCMASYDNYIPFMFTSTKCFQILTLWRTMIHRTSQIVSLITNTVSVLWKSRDVNAKDKTLSSRCNSKVFNTMETYIKKGASKFTIMSANTNLGTFLYLGPYFEYLSCTW
jgi:hypothetical protein